ncbi:Spo0E family sporulation regulatory protein-aspartic acid phosphatase [Vallitalea okinawensis]|uniref:Spo0E family sporulation regulatory protein-aspartic acid phosphatase n=1 Tax=Vallitalea okinawensis TaxID=2078660 RepID=UPI001300A66A
MNTDMEMLRERLYDLIKKEAPYSDILEVSILLDQLIASHYCEFKGFISPNYTN